MANLLQLEIYCVSFPLLLQIILHCCIQTRTSIIILKLSSVLIQHRQSASTFGPDEYVASKNDLQKLEYSSLGATISVFLNVPNDSCTYPEPSYLDFSEVLFNAGTEMLAKCLMNLRQYDLLPRRYLNFLQLTDKCVSCSVYCLSALWTFFLPMKCPHDSQNIAIMSISSTGQQ